MSQSVALHVLEERDRFLARARDMARAGHEVVGEWVSSRPDVSWVEPDGGVCAFLRLDRMADTASFAERLFTERGVAVAEGELFGCPGWIRVAFGGPGRELREGLRRIGTALDGAAG